MGKTYSASNLIVGVTYYNNRSVSVIKTCNAYEKLLERYIGQLKELNKEGIVSGNVADVLSDFILEVEKAKRIITDIGNDYSREIKGFLHAIDVADDKIFKNRGRKILTDAEFNNARAVAKVEFSLETLFNGTYILNLFWTGPVSEQLVSQKSAMMRRVKELNEYTRSEISKIQGECKNTDQKYAKRICNIYKELKRYNSIIIQISKIVSPQQNCFNKKNISKLRNMIKSYEKYRKEVVKDPEVDKIADTDVKYFADNVLDYFNKSVASIRYICETSLGNLVLTDFDKYRTTVNEANEFFNSYSKNYKYSKEKFDKAKKTVDELYDLYKKYGSNWDEYCPDKEKAKFFKKILEKFGDAGKNLDQYIDIWYQMFYDMSESWEVLKRFKSNCDMTDENVRKAIERIEKLYNKNIDAYISETFEELVRFLANKGKKAAVDAVVSELKSRKESRILGMLVESIFDQAFAEMPAIAQLDWIEATNKALNNAIAKLRKVDIGSKDYAEHIKAVREAFDAAKKAQLKFFKTILASAKTDTEKAYYQYCYNTINNASLDDISSLDIMYETQFNGQNYNPLTDLEY